LISKPLSQTQLKALRKLSDGQPRSAYMMGVTLPTLEVLSRKGFVRAVGNGHFAFPRTASWQITPAGQKAVPPKVAGE
jgi:hypothetical protein